MGGAHTSANAGMSSVRRVSKHAHRMAEVSYGRFILVGLVGPKPRPKGVGDGHPVYIQEPLLIVINEGVTQSGSPSALWLCASKFVAVSR